MTTKSTYDTTASQVFELFSDYLEGAYDNPVLVLSHNGQLAQDARDALVKSAAALGFGDESCTFATLGDTFDDQALFMLIEGIDPLVVVATDEAATELLTRTYRTTYPTDAAVRAFGRNAVVFADLQSLIATDAGKQQAWHLLKTLR